MFELIYGQLAWLLAWSTMFWDLYVVDGVMPVRIEPNYEDSSPYHKSHAMIFWFMASAVFVLFVRSIENSKIKELIPP